MGEIAAEFGFVEAAVWCRSPPVAQQTYWASLHQGWASASGPMSPASAFRHPKSLLILVLDCSQHRHINSFRYRTDRMPYSPPFRHLKSLQEGEEGYTLHVHTLQVVERDTPSHC
jgi:hypothetical protein